MSAAEPLYRLQQLDTELDQLRRRVDQVSARMTDRSEVEQTRQELLHLEERLKMETDKLQAYEAQARALDEKINTEEKRLYGGQIRLPKAILEVEQELSMLRRQRSALDDAIIDQMARVERLQDEVKHARTRAEVVEAHFAGESALLREERQRLLDQARVLIEQRKTLARNLPAALLQTYESVRSRRPDTPAVALIKAGACSQCGEAVSSADAQRAHTGDRLVFCANCGRILYLP